MGQPLGYEVFTKVLRCLLGGAVIAFARGEMGLCWIPSVRSIKGRDAVILLLLHVLHMYMFLIIGDVYNDGEMTGKCSFQTTHVRLFHAC